MESQMTTSGAITGAVVLAILGPIVWKLIGLGFDRLFSQIGKPQEAALCGYSPELAKEYRHRFQAAHDDIQKMLTRQSEDLRLKIKLDEERDKRMGKQMDRIEEKVNDMGRR